MINQVKYKYLTNWITYKHVWLYNIRTEKYGKQTQKTHKYTSKHEM